MAPVSWKGATLSSTRIRAAIREGKIKEAHAMMGREFVLDMGAAHLHHEETTVRVEKMSLSQVLPPPGSYYVDIQTPALNIPALIHIGEEEIVWEQEEKHSVKAIRFTETTEEGERDAHEREKAGDY
jgi:FAD synthase